LMEQERINKYLRWLEKGIRIFVGGVLFLEIGTFIFVGVFLWFNGRDIVISLNAWQLGLGLAWNMIKIVAMSYCIFGKWHLEYKKKDLVDPTLIGKDW